MVTYEIMFKQHYMYVCMRSLLNVHTGLFNLTLITFYCNSLCLSHKLLDTDALWTRCLWSSSRLRSVIFRHISLYCMDS